MAQPAITLYRRAGLEVDLTAHRAAFVVSNDLALAARFIQMEPTSVGGLQPKEKAEMAELAEIDLKGALA